MPLFDFRCMKCDKIFEIYKKLNEEAEVKYPDCQSFEIRRVWLPGTLNVSLPMHEYYDNGLGMVVKGKSHRNAIMKEKGLIEMGTEKLDLAKQERDRERVQGKKMERLKGEAMKMLDAGGNPAWN